MVIVKIAAVLIAVVCVAWTTFADWINKGWGPNHDVPIIVRTVDLIAAIGLWVWIGYDLLLR